MEIQHKYNQKKHLLDINQIFNKKIILTSQNKE